MADGFVLEHQRPEFLGDPPLGAQRPGLADLEFLGAHEDRAAAHQAGAALAFQALEVAPDGHVVHPELTGGADDVHPAGFAEQLKQDLPPLFGCERSAQAHRFPILSRSAPPLSGPQGTWPRA